ncbi:putative odorant receptor 92a [Leptopilina heterotoma]|uniref:putative odorant receptor 92a n=1 Tax=Leptopilina heterotoma TaxID=63436 RepID=UPI001CA8ACC9|nr:putative odorant receptor 92a [Leptopilina heterotoma]
MVQTEEKMKNSNFDYNYVVKVARTLLTPLGIWPRYGNNTIFSKIQVTLHIIIVFSFMLFLLIPHLFYTFVDAEDLKKLMKIIAAQIFSSLGVIKFWTMIIKKKEIRKCLEDIEENFKNVETKEDRDVMVKNAKIGRMFTIAYLGLSYGGALPYHIIMPLMEERIVREDNSTQIPLPYLTDYIFFQVETSPFYYEIFVLQIFISSLILSTNCGVYSMLAAVIMHSVCLFEIVCKRLENLSKELNIVAELRVIIEMHHRAIKYAERIERSLNVVFLCEVVGCTIIICFLEYGVLQDWEENDALGTMTYAILMTSIFVNVYIICYIGEKLKEQSSRVGYSTYSIEWYSLPKNVVVDLLFLMIRSEHPTCLTAAKMADLSLQAFTGVVKTSAAYLNFLRALEIS